MKRNLMKTSGKYWIMCLLLLLSGCSASRATMPEEPFTFDSIVCSAENTIGRSLVQAQPQEPQKSPSPKRWAFAYRQRPSPRHPAGLRSAPPHKLPERGEHVADRALGKRRIKRIPISGVQIKPGRLVLE